MHPKIVCRLHAFAALCVQSKSGNPFLVVRKKTQQMKFGLFWIDFSYEDTAYCTLHGRVYFSKDSAFQKKISSLALLAQYSLFSYFLLGSTSLYILIESFSKYIHVDENYSF